MTVTIPSIEIPEWAILSVFGPVLYWYVGVLWGRLYRLMNPVKIIIYENRSRAFNETAHARREADVATQATALAVVWPLSMPTVLTAYLFVGVAIMLGWFVKVAFFDFIADAKE